jgi:tetratricopeptide (TPR) repeat protein
MKLFTLISCSLLLTTGNVISQTIKEKDRLKFETLSNQKDSAALNIAIANKDFDAAATFNYRLLVNDNQNIEKLYQLAEIHFAAKKYELAINSSRRIISIDSMHAKSFSLAAKSFIELKQIKSAAGVFQLMYQRFEKVNYLYDKAIVEFQNKQSKESLNTLSDLLSDTTSLSENVEIINTNEEGKTTKQSIPYAAAAYNVAGYILLQEKNYELAKAQLEASIKISPEFIFANNNLRQVLELEAQIKSAPKEETKKPK